MSFKNKIKYLWDRYSIEFWIPFGFASAFVLFLLFLSDFTKILNIESFTSLNAVAILVCIFFSYAIFTLVLKKSKGEIPVNTFLKVKRLFLLIIATEIIAKTLELLFFYSDSLLATIQVINIVLCFFGFITGSLLASHKQNLNTENDGNKEVTRRFILPLICVFFIASRILMPIIYTGSYQDEYSHLDSGVEILKSGHPVADNNYSSGYYTRGYIVSLMVAAVFSISGKSILAAKMIPAVIGIVNFFILMKISRFVLQKDKYRALLLILYTVSPFVIFNHFYIRMYVFYEFIALINILLIFLIEKNINKSKLKVGLCILGVVFSNLVNIVLNQDQGTLLILVIPLIYLIFFAPWPYSTKLNLLLIKIKNIKGAAIVVAGAVIASFGSILYLIHAKLSDFFFGTFPGTTPLNLKYENFFLNINALLSIFFIIVLFNYHKIKSRSQKILVAATSCLLLLHLLSSTDIQLTRVILYILPLFFLVAVMGIEEIGKITSDKMVISLLLLSVILNPPLYQFLKLPELSEEVYYVDYQEVVHFIETDCQNKKTYLLHISYNLNFRAFYNLKIDYIPYIRAEYLANDDNFVKNSDGYFSIDGSTKVLEDPSYLEKINSPVCIIAPNRFRFAWRNILKNDFDILDQSFQVKKLRALNIYYN